jgi:hypothetical protein
LGNPKGAVVLFVVVWPWYVGASLAVEFGAANPSLARTLTGWVFEAPWLALLAFAIYRFRRFRRERAAFERRDRIAHRADNTAQAAEKTDTATTKVRCLHCQHVQTVSVSQETFACEQCKAHLKRPTAPAKSS